MRVYSPVGIFTPGPGRRGFYPPLFIFISFIIAVLPAAAQTTGTVNQPQAVELRFVQSPGEVIHADAEVHESVYVNGVYSHDAVIGESSVSRILSADESGGAEIEATFRTEERISGLPGYVEWVSSESVLFRRDSLGRMTVPPEAARPVLRNLPVFPDKAVTPGTTWSAPLEEVHLFRFGEYLAGPYRSTVPATYEFSGTVESGGRELARILISYNLYLPIDRSDAALRFLSGRSLQVLLWDADYGRPVTRTEEFEFLMMMADGSVREFKGKQRVDYRYTEVLDRGETVDLLKNELKTLPGIQVAPDAQGVRLTLSDAEGAVYFDPESSEIRPDQQRRLESLSGVLAQFRGRDVLITGHTADFGTERGRYLLSMDRAAAVAGVLFPQGKNGSGRLFLRGMGSGEPVGTDADNRRVEVLILD